jgi:hydrogenase-4 component B
LGYTVKIGADLLSTQAASSTDLTGLIQATPPTLTIVPATTALPNLGADVLAVALIGVVILVWLCTSLLTCHFGRKNTPMRRSIPWGCGLDLTPAMQYSGLGLAEPARVIFNPLLRLKSALLRAKGTPVGHYQLTIPVPGEGMLYKPVRDLMIRLAERVRRVQAGSLQLYLAYLFATLVVLLLFAR